MGTKTRRHMRKLYIYMVIFALCGCEVIAENERLIPTGTDVYGERTHVLLEFTGFLCVNCPLAAETAQSLTAIYGEHLAVVALHPASNPLTQGKYDYTCPEADSIYRFMGGTKTTTFPTGNVDIRRQDDRWFYDRDEWPALVSQAMTDTVAPYLRISTQVDTVTRQVDVTAFYTPTEENRLTLWLVEDSIKGAQAMPDGSVNMEYYHRHVLRATSDELSFTVPTQCDLTHCAVLALIVNKNDYHILNAYEKKLDYPGSPSAGNN